MSQATFKVIDRKVGLFGGTMLVIGNVIAMTVFLLPAHLIADYNVGPEIALAMIIVSMPMATRILGSLQVGGAMPAAGGSYVYSTRLIHPYFGFLLPWMAIPAMWAGQVYLAFGFAEFVRFFEPFSWIPMPVLMYAILVPFIIVNILGIRMVAIVQMILVSIIIVGMLTFIVPGTMHVDTSNYTPLFPEGYGPFFISIVSLGVALSGFGLATALGEELQDPVKNIPRVLVASAAISIFLMVGVVVVAVGVVPTDFYVDAAGNPVEAGVAVAAGEFLPPLAAAVVAFAAVVAAFTTINTLYTGSSRSVMRAARDEIIPLYFAELHPKYETPHRAILLLGVPPLLVVPFQFSPVWLTLVLSMSGLITGLFSSFALWNLPKRFPERYEHSLYRLPLPVLKGVAIVGFLVSVLFLFAVSTTLWWLAILVSAYLVAGYPFYRWRVRTLRERGIDLPSRMTKLHTHEIERAEAGGRLGTNRPRATDDTSEPAVETDDDSVSRTDD